MRELSNREKLILYISAAIIYLAINAVFIFTPVIARNSRINDEYRAVNLKINRYLRLLQREAYIKEKAAQFNLNVAAAEKEQDKLAAILSELEDTAKKSNIQITDMRPQSQELAASKEVTVAVQAEANIDGFTKFIYDVENSRLLLRIKRFQLNPKPNSQSLQGDFTIAAVSG